MRGNVEKLSRPTLLTQLLSNHVVNMYVRWTNKMKCWNVDVNGRSLLGLA